MLRNILFLSITLCCSHLFASNGDILDISSGPTHTCALKKDRALCWGYNAYGQALNIHNFKNARLIASTYHTNCVVDDDGIWCWGLEPNRQSEVVLELGPITSLTAGMEHFCASDGDKLRCWGRNAADFETPEISRIKQLTSHRNASCARTEQGAVCWGPQMLKKFSEEFLAATDIALGANFVCFVIEQRLKCRGAFTFDPQVLGVTKVSMSGDRICALAEEKLHCWTESLEMPSAIQEGKWRRTTISTNHNCVASDQEVKCYGENQYGQSQVPPDASSVKNVVLNADGTCSLLDGKVQCWGKGNFPPSNLSNVLELQGKVAHFCARTATDLICWGGSLAHFTTQPPVVGKIKKLAVGGGLSCFEDSERVKCWGMKGSRYDFPENLKDVDFLAAGNGHACAIKNSEPICWGTSLFDPPPKLKKVKGLYAGAEFTCADTEDDGLQCWGLETLWLPPKGLKGFDSFSVTNTKSCGVFNGEVKCWGPPRDVLNLPTNLPPASKVVAGYSHACATTTEGLRCWGNNTYGESNLYNY